MDNTTTVIIEHNEIRDLNSWFICMANNGYEKLAKPLIQAHLDINDIFISPTACFLITPIATEPAFGKVYKDMFLIHPNEKPDGLLPILCTNDNMLDRCFPPQEKQKELNLNRKNLNRVRYMNILEDDEFLLKSFYNHNFHLVGIYNTDWLHLFEELG